MGLPYPIGHGVTHLATMFGGGLVFLAASLCLTEFVEGEHTPVLIALGGVGLLYFSDAALHQWHTARLVRDPIRGAKADGRTGGHHWGWGHRLGGDGRESHCRGAVHGAGNPPHPARRLLR